MLFGYGNTYGTLIGDGRWSLANCNGRRRGASFSLSRSTAPVESIDLVGCQSTNEFALTQKVTTASARTWSGCQREAGNPANEFVHFLFNWDFFPHFHYITLVERSWFATAF
jgi:hypothetical protein